MRPRSPKSSPRVLGHDLAHWSRDARITSSLTVGRDRRHRRGAEAELARRIKPFAPRPLRQGARLRTTPSSRRRQRPSPPPPGLSPRRRRPAHRPRGQGLCVPTRRPRHRRRPLRPRHRCRRATVTHYHEGGSPRNARTSKRTATPSSWRRTTPDIPHTRPGQRRRDHPAPATRRPAVPSRRHAAAVDAARPARRRRERIRARILLNPRPAARRR
jgi:hypothetical protein